MMRYQVRFHLGKGANYGKWQVKQGSLVRYYDPAHYSLTLLDCHLRNHPKTAAKIHDGANKKVCCWVDCNEVIAHEPINPIGVPVSYNPRVAPYWRNVAGDNIDGKRIEVLRSNGRQLFFCGERCVYHNGVPTLAAPAAEEHALGPMRKER